MGKSHFNTLRLSKMLSPTLLYWPFLLGTLNKNANTLLFTFIVQGLCVSEHSSFATWQVCRIKTLIKQHEYHTGVPWLVTIKGQYKGFYHTTQCHSQVLSSTDLTNVVAKLEWNKSFVLTEQVLGLLSQLVKNGSESMLRFYLFVQ